MYVGCTTLFHSTPGQRRNGRRISENKSFFPLRDSIKEHNDQPFLGRVGPTAWDYPCTLRFFYLLYNQQVTFYEDDMLPFFLRPISILLIPKSTSLYATTTSLWATELPLHPYPTFLWAVTTSLWATNTFLWATTTSLWALTTSPWAYTTSLWVTTTFLWATITSL
jgi:hypothetical protein